MPFSVDLLGDFLNYDFYTLQSVFAKMIVHQNDRRQLFWGEIFELSKMIVRQNDSFPPTGRNFFELSKMICSAK